MVGVDRIGREQAAILGKEDEDQPQQHREQALRRPDGDRRASTSFEELARDWSWPAWKPRSSSYSAASTCPARRG